MAQRKRYRTHFNPYLPNPSIGNSASSSSSQKPAAPLNEGFALGGPRGDCPIPVDRAQANRRSDAPLVKVYQRGSNSLATSLAACDAGRAHAVQLIGDQEFAASSIRSRASKLGTWDKLAKEANVCADVLTGDSIKLLTGLLVAANYRSATSYLEIAVDRHIKSGWDWSQQLQKAVDGARRAANRGLGPASKTGAFPLEKLQIRSLDVLNTNLDFPIGGRAVHAINTWFLLREIESSNILVQDVRFSGKTVRIMLTASKTDPSALAVTRELACMCDILGLAPELCPYCSTLQQVKLVYSICKPISKEAWHLLPLMPTPAGGVVSKRAMVLFLNITAESAGIECVAHNGSKKLGGHAWRRGGVHMLHGLGVATIDIQFHARHSSGATLGYLQGANGAATRASMVRAGWSLPQLFKLQPEATERLLALAPTLAPGSAVSGNTGGKTHEVDSSGQLTLCKWPYRTNWRTTSPALAQVSCRKCCAKKLKLAAGTGSSSSSSCGSSSS
jgi:hypothetical protein